MCVCVCVCVYVYIYIYIYIYYFVSFRESVNKCFLRCIRLTVIFGRSFVSDTKTSV